jgi:thiamine biosynthesis lipoprotein
MFDISVGPLVNAWGFGFKGKQFPDSVQILNLLPRIGYQKIKIVDGKIIKDRPDIEIDPSSAAEGYGVDVVANLLEKKGIENYLVEIGGEIRSKGINSKGKKWTVGIDKPIEGEYNATGEIQEIVSIDSGAISTSGNYRKFYYRDGKKYAHVINPHTGYPSEHQILSVTVYADDCMSADAYSTVFMVMGLESTQMFLKSHPELSAYIISSKDTNSYSIWMSDSFKELVSKP